MSREFRLLWPALAAAALFMAAASPAMAAPERPSPGTFIDTALLGVANAVGDDVFATTDLTALIDPTANSTQHYGPFPSTSTDSGTCGNDWANDTFDRHFTIHHESNGTFTIIEQFKDGTFVTPASDSPPVNFSPGGCQPTPPPQGMVNPLVAGSLHGYFVIPNVPGGSQTSTSPFCNALTNTNDNCDTTTFIDTHFTPCYLMGSGTCPVTTFFFHYAAGDQSLLFHEWKNASADRGGNSGDIRSVNI